MKFFIFCTRLFSLIPLALFSWARKVKSIRTFYSWSELHSNYKPRLNTNNIREVINSEKVIYILKDTQEYRNCVWIKQISSLKPYEIIEILKRKLIISQVWDNQRRSFLCQNALHSDKKKKNWCATWLLFLQCLHKVEFHNYNCSK